MREIKKFSEDWRRNYDTELNQSENNCVIFVIVLFMLFYENLNPKSNFLWNLNFLKKIFHDYFFVENLFVLLIKETQLCLIWLVMIFIIKRRENAKMLPNIIISI
jgi:hypothetical protein